MYKKVTFLSIIFLLIIFSCESDLSNNTIYQTSTINSLLDANYEGDVSFETLKEKGDFGIGTFNYLDGEMIAYDGIFYQIKSNGQAYIVNKDTKTPFAITTFFTPDITNMNIDTLNYEQLTEYLDKLLPSENIFYAIKIEGKFNQIKTRSVPKQNKPYKPLIDIVKNQPTFNIVNTEGILIGFKFPEYIENINVPGYHFHFLTKDRTKGGHVLELSGYNFEISIDSIHSMHLELPRNKTFYQMKLSTNKKEELNKVEK